MKFTVDCYDAKQIMKVYDRDYYSVNGLAAILEYFDEIDENAEFDPVAICCECTEFGNHGAICSFANMINDYEYFYTAADWMQDTGAEEYSEDDYIAALVEVLEDKTQVLHVCNGNYIVFAF